MTPKTRRSRLSLFLVCAGLLGGFVLPVVHKTHGEPDVSQAKDSITGDWPQWGGSSVRNNAPTATNLPEEWDVGGFDRKTGAWQSENAEHVKWVAAVGSQTYGNPVIADGRVYVGTNNGHGYLQRYPGNVDLGCLLAFNAADGRFLWQHSSEKLASGRVHDWPLQGICCAPLVEGDRCWFVTSRGHVVCVDTEGYYDGEDDGPQTAGQARLFKEPSSVIGGLDEETLPSAVKAALTSSGFELGKRTRIEAETPGEAWRLTVGRGSARKSYQLMLDEDQISVSGEDGNSATMPADLTAGLAEGKIGSLLAALLASRGLSVADDAQVTADGATKWNVQSGDRQLVILREGSSLSAYKMITLDDQREADEVWVFDMMSELKVSQHNMCSCSVTAIGDILFVNTSNGVDESHINLPSKDAPSFIAMDKHTGEVLWTDASPGENILHGQWSSPAAGELGGVSQVIFTGGDGWVYSFKADRKKELLWKFDANPKESEWILGGRGDRNNIIATPVIYKERVYVAVGQDPEHGPGQGHLWCLDPTKRGDVSAQKVVKADNPDQIVPPRRLDALNEKNGEVAVDNPNSAAIWHYTGIDQNGDGEMDVEETMNRSCGTVAVKDDILYIADFSGIFHCLNALTGEVNWTYDMMSQAWGSPLIADGKVYIGDEDGEVAVFQHSVEPQEPLAEVDMLNSVYSTPVVAHNVMYISNKTHLFAIQKTDE